MINLMIETEISYQYQWKALGKWQQNAMDIVQKTGREPGRPKKTGKNHLSIHMKESGVLGFWGILHALKRSPELIGVELALENQSEKVLF